MRFEAYWNLKTEEEPRFEQQIVTKGILGKICKAHDIYLDTGENVYFTDDLVSEDVVNGLAARLFPDDSDWLFYKQVKPFSIYDLTHVQKHPIVACGASILTAPLLVLTKETNQKHSNMRTVCIRDT